MDDVLGSDGGPEKIGPDQADRDKAGRFVKGNSGNPKGRPVGSRHEALKLLDQMGSENAAAVMRTLLKKALEDEDMRALEVMASRLWPAWKGRPVKFDLGRLETAQDSADAAAAVLREVAAGQLSPEEGAAIAGLLAAHRDATLVAEMAERLERLEGVRGMKR
jgi:hypothetical protein